MATSVTRGLLVAATLLGSVLAGAGLDRALVQTPAWREVGAQAWAAYSRHADLSIRGLVLYPVLGIGGAVLSVGAAVSFQRHRSRPHFAAVAIYAGALLTIGGLLLTTQAAPIMLSVAHLGDETTVLRRAMDGFAFWSGLRVVLQCLAFIANLWALAAVVPREPARNG
jgi:hypothetical protein